MKPNRAVPMRHAAAMLASAAIVLALLMTMPTDGDSLGEHRDIGIRHTDKLFVEISIMRGLGVRDRKLD